MIDPKEKALKDTEKLTAFYMHVLSVNHEFGLIRAFTRSETIKPEAMQAVASLAKLAKPHAEIVAKVADEYNPQGELTLE
jgi:hypothetical protein